MLKVAKVIVENRRKSGVSHRGQVMVFVPDPKRPGPFGNKKGTIADEFLWRRENEAPYPADDIQVALAPVLAEIKMKVRKITWDRKAGCGMCPCSPGYVVYGEDREFWFRTSVWLTDDSLAPEEAPEVPQLICGG